MQSTPPPRSLFKTDFFVTFLWKLSYCLLSLQLRITFFTSTVHFYTCSIFGDVIVGWRSNKAVGNKNKVGYLLFYAQVNRGHTTPKPQLWCNTGSLCITTSLLPSNSVCTSSIRKIWRPLLPSDKKSRCYAFLIYNTNSTSRYDGFKRQNWVKNITIFLTALRSWTESCC